MTLDHLLWPEHLERAEFLVLGLHGRGADMRAFLPFVRQMRLPRARWILPSAPVATGAPDSFQWFEGLQPAAEQVAAARASITALLREAVASEGIGEENVFLVGFSQGAAIALDTALRHPRRLGGVVALSGFVIDPVRLAAERTTANLRMPIFLAHGLHDRVLPIEVGRANREALQNAGCSVDYREYDTRHRVSAAEARDTRAFLHRHMHGMDPDDPRRVDEHVVPF